MNSSHLNRLEWNMEVTKRALKNLEIAVKKENELDVYCAIGEMLLWICTTDDWYLKHKNNYKIERTLHQDGELLLGIRYAFNAFKHNMEIVQIHQIKGGVTFPIMFPLEIESVTFQWALIDEQFTGHKNQIKNY